MKTGILKKGLEEIKKSEHPIFKISAIIFKGSRIISIGHSCFRMNGIPAKYKKFSHSLHAEQAAIINGKKEKMKSTSILVLRVNPSMNLSLAYPCFYCMESIKLVGIKWLYFSDRSGEIKKEKIRY